MARTDQTIKEQIISWLPFSGTNKYMGQFEKTMKEVYSAAVGLGFAGLVFASAFNVYFKNGPGSTPNFEESQTIKKAQEERYRERFCLEDEHAQNHKTLGDIE